MKHSMLSAALAAGLLYLATPARVRAQTIPTATEPASRVPRTPDGHPDLSGV